MNDELNDVPGLEPLKAAGYVDPVPAGVIDRCVAELRVERGQATTDSSLAEVIVIPTSTGRRVPGRRVAVAALATASALVVGLVATNASSSENTTTEVTDASAPALLRAEPAMPSTAPPIDRFGGLCEAYSIDTLAERDFAFDGNVLSVEPGPKGRRLTTFRVNEWFAGGSGERATVPMTPMSTQGREETGTNRDLDGEERGPTYGAETRLLVSGEFRSTKNRSLADAFVWSCGWSRYHDKETAGQWRETFAAEKRD